jgi:hypothetical protein
LIDGGPVANVKGKARDTLGVANFSRKRPHGDIEPLWMDPSDRHGSAVGQNRLCNRAPNPARPPGHDRSTH